MTRHYVIFHYIHKLYFFSRNQYLLFVSKTLFLNIFFILSSLSPSLSPSNLSLPSLILFPPSLLTNSRPLRQQGRVNPAVSLLESHFIPEDEEGGDTGRLLADLLLQEGRQKEAEDIFLRLAAAQPSNPAVLADYAAFLHKLGQS